MPGKILVVDDVATNRIILKAKLGIACYDVIQAADGETALSKAASDRPDLILLDLAMPGMSGLEVLRALKAEPLTAEIPVVIVSSHMDRRSRLAALEAGAEDFLTKPVDDMLLAARVRSLLRARLLADELDLRDGTRRALGFSEDQAPFAAPPVVGPAARIARSGAPERAALRDERPGRIALIDFDAGDSAWIDAVGQEIPHRIARLTRADAMRLARGTPRLPETAPPADSDAPEVFVILPGADQGHDGMMLLSELRAGPGTCNSAIVIATPAESRAQAAIALDLGASDVLPLPLAPQEAALRLARQLSRTRRAHAARRKVRDGLQLAVTDPLTGLPNRRYGLSQLERSLERALEVGVPLTVLMFDLDRFKAVNDRHGHAAGDAVLRAVTTRIQPHLRKGDLLARIGGEEFLVILPDVAEGDAMETAERLRRAVDAIPIALPPPDVHAGKALEAATHRTEVHQTVSVGLASGPTRTERDLAQRAGLVSATAALLERADAALLRAKSSGRNRVVLSEVGQDGEAAA